MYNEEEFTSKAVYTLVIDLINSTDRILALSSLSRDIFFTSFAKVLVPYVNKILIPEINKNKANNCVIKFTGDGWIIAVSDINDVIKLTVLAKLLMHKFNDDINQISGLTFNEPWKLRLAIAFGSDVSIDFFGQPDFVGDSVRRATRISTLCNPDEILIDEAINTIIQRDFEIENINVKKRRKEKKVIKIESDISTVFSIVGIKDTDSIKPGILVYLFDQLGNRSKTENFINQINEEISRDNLSITDINKIDEASIYIAAIGKEKEAEKIDEKLKYQ